MIITIQPDELLPEFRQPWRLGYIKHLSIDYADNAIYAIFQEKLVTIFKFDNFGWINDNRFNIYLISVGPAGIMIQILSRE